MTGLHVLLGALAVFGTLVGVAVKFSYRELINQIHPPLPPVDPFADVDELYRQWVTQTKGGRP